MIEALVTLHVVSGSGAAVGMIGALASKKGGQWHRRSGRLYTISMAVALSLALLVSALTINVFLFLIGLFSGYFVYTGWRLAVARDGVMRPHDLRLAQLMVLFAAVMMIYGVYQVVSGDGFGVALAAFGVVALLPALADCRRAEGWPKGKDRIALHLARMGGASIATLTAVFVVNIETDPVYIAWLLPTVIGTPLIVFGSRRVKR